MTTEKLLRPNCNGWWDWYEGGGYVAERILVSGDGKIVAFDDEWEAEMGRAPSDCDNYWEGTETTPEHMPGFWRFVSPAALLPQEPDHAAE